MNNINNFILITEPRSGSSYLTSLLNSHPQLHCYSELFSLFPHKLINERNLYNSFTTHLDPYNFLNHFYSNSFHGFKYFSIHNPLVLNYLLENPQIKIIFLQRTNKLSQLASFLLAQSNDVWSNYSHTNSITFSSNHFSLLSSWINKSLFLLNSLYQNNHNIFCINYEDLISNYNFNDLFHFLNIDSYSLSSFYTKQESRPLDSFVSNYSSFSSSYLLNFDYFNFIYTYNLHL